MYKLEEQPEVIVNDLGLEDGARFMKGVVTSPLKFFCPNGAQERYINTVAECTEDTKIPVILCTFANGVGKTTSSLHILFNFIFGPQSGWFDYPVFHNFKFPKTVWYISTASALIETVQPMIEKLVCPEFCKDRAYQVNKDGRTIISRMRFKNGWQIFFKTFDQAQQKFESANVGLVVIDEPAPEEIWKAVKSRRRKGCITLLPMTPLDCPPYILDEIYKAVNEGRKGYYHLEASVYDACKKRGIRGHLEPDIVDDMVAGYDEDEKEARAYGKFMYFSRVIYRELDPKIHFVDPEDWPIPLHSQILQIVDPHDSRPCAGIWLAKAPNGRLIIFDEYPVEKDRNYWEFKTGFEIEYEVKIWIDIEIRQKLNEIYTLIAPIIRILDRHFGWQTRGKKTFAQLFKEAGEKLHKSFVFIGSYIAPDNETEIEFGHKVVRKLLKPMEDGQPGLLIWNTCFHTMNGLTHYIREKMKGVAAETKPEADGRIVEKYKDFPDLVRYAACSDVIAKVPAKEIDPKHEQWLQVTDPKFKKKTKGYLSS